MRVRLEYDQIMMLAEEKFLDMKERKVWNQVDPRDAQLMSLTTQLNELKEARNANTDAAAHTTANGNGGGNSSKLPFDINNKKTWTKVKGTRIFEWRTKYQGDTLTVLKKTITGVHIVKFYGWHKPEYYNKLKSK